MKYLYREYNQLFISKITPKYDTMILKKSKQIKACFFLTLLIFTFTFAADKLSRDYLILSQIQSPIALLSENLPANYSVPLTLSGSIAREIKSVLDTIKFGMVHYTELFDKKKRFELLITNKDYTTQTRDLLAGILNPVEMTEIILNAILKYQKQDALVQIQKETAITSSKKGGENSHLTYYTLTPRGKRFCYDYKDMGAYVHESWLTELQVAIDLQTMLAYTLTVKKHTRSFSTDQDKQPKPSVAVHTYMFDYTMANNVPVPSKLTLHVDSVMVLTLSASYRKHEKYILFDQREITYFLPDKSTSHLTLHYGTYQFTNALKPSKPEGKGRYSKKLKRAAVLSRKAIEALNSGQIHKAVTLLEAIRDNYPGTPQAVEAQKLLSGLPNGL